MKQNRRTGKMRGGDPPTINITTQKYIGGYETGDVSKVKRFKESATLGDLFRHIYNIQDMRFRENRNITELYMEGIHSGVSPIYIGGTDCTKDVVSHNPNENEILNKPLSCFFTPTTDKDDIHQVDWMPNGSPWAEWGNCTKPTQKVANSLAYIRSRPCPPEPALPPLGELPGEEEPLPTDDSEEEEPLPADDSDDEDEKPVSRSRGGTRRRRSRERSASSRRRKTVSRRRRKRI
jgi:hypothetical protein